jgi:hypothetical protein
VGVDLEEVGARTFLVGSGGANTYADDRRTLLGGDVDAPRGATPRLLLLLGSSARTGRIYDGSVGDDPVARLVHRVSFLSLLIAPLLARL